MKLPPNTLAIRFTAAARELLFDFVNTRLEVFERFEEKWLEKGNPVGWVGGIEDFVSTQQIIRDIWEGKRPGEEGWLIKHALARRDGWGQSFVDFDWEQGSIFLAPRDLNDFVWLALLQDSRSLAICANRDGGCPTPYFIKVKPQQKFCCEDCAKPAQQEFKRQWWAEHGQRWRDTRKRKQHSKSIKRS